ncbi:MAG: DUF305 domain-containing protein [Actinomycetota bacterium]|nr:DUF305 domain-containing protein [Actinomycetota bacterium]
MSVLNDDRITEDSAGAPPAPPSRGLRLTLIAIIAIAVLVVAGVGGWLLRGGSGTSTPSANSVDAGFAQDMITHHIQAVTMAGVERDGTANKELHSLAFDIETGQNFQVGQMSGWLDDWNVSRNSANPMAWMGHSHMAMGANRLMPGMATSTQMDQLLRPTGTARDILFLQLMIHHHQGGIPMAQYARTHAAEGYVRDLAQSMINSQSSELLYMEQLLRGLGGHPLPPPT